jgi:hypothetical protein
MSTVQETLLPAAMVPGLVTIEDSKGNRKNVFPIDAKEIIANGDATLVENGAIEAARMAATPLRSGYASGIPSDQIIAEVAGVEGRIVAASDAETAEEVKDAGDSPDANREPAPAGSQVGFTAMQDAKAEEFNAGQAAGAEQKPAPKPAPPKAEQRPAPSAADKKD